ncbi:MAG: hypothetical protein AABY01_00655 [Nanoarchaeota archaeon]
MSKRFLLSLLIVSICAIASVSAIEFSADLNSTQASTNIGSAASYKISIKHDSEVSERFDIYSPDVEWDITTDIPRPVSVEAGETQDVILYVKPLYASPGYYAITLNIRHSSTGELLKKTIVIGVQPKDYIPGQYTPAVRLKPDVTQNADPRDPVVVTINVTNGNARNLKNIVFKVRSNLINVESVIDLPGLERKQLVFPVKLPALTAPQKDILYVTALVQDGDQIIPFTAEPVDFEIAEYGEINSAVATQDKFLKSDSVYTLTNTGNAEKSTVFKRKTALLESWFTTSIPVATSLVLPEGLYDSWNVKLGVGEQTTIKVMTNYRPLLLVFIVLAIAIGSYYIFRSPLVVRKSAVVIAAKEGGMSELKVLIEISNRSAKPVRDVHVLDKVPHIAEVSHDFDVGTLRPTKVTHLPNKGTLIKWTLDELDGGEERVITYRIHSKLSILGQMRLPVAVTKFRVGNRERRTKSNISQIGFGN